jgi:glycosyltransferase involved in cell wall biosynthesis
MSGTLTESPRLSPHEMKSPGAPATTVTKPRILMVTPQYFPHMGGVQTHIYHVSPELSDAGFEITILTTDTSGELPPEEYVDGTRILRVPAWPSGSDYYLSPSIYRTIVSGDWDLIHCQGCHTLVAPMAMLAARHARIPYIVTFHTGGHSTSWRNRIRSLQWRTLRPLLRGAAGLVAVSQFEADLFRNHLGVEPDRITVIPNGAEVPELTEPVQPDPTAPMILSVGRLEQYKGHHRVIAALPHVRRKIPNAHLRIAGTGPFESNLVEQARELGMDNYVEIGSIPVADRSGMARLVAGATVFTLVSDYEAHPIAVMEALALGIPVVVANTSGLREIADQGFATAVPLDSSPVELAEVLINKIHHPDPPADFTLPTWQGCASSLSSLYRQVTGSSI